MRDTLKGKEYFEEFILEDLERVNWFSKQLRRRKVRRERIFPVKAKIHDLKLGVMIAKYSKGDSLEMLEKEYLQLIKEWGEVFEKEYYNKNLKMISLAVLFEVDHSIIENIKLMLQKENVNDWLFNFLLNTVDNKNIEDETELLFPESYSLLKEVVYEENREELLKKYLLEEWYNEDCGCYEAHKSKENIYYGYWSFEAGAIAKILKLNDDDLKNIQYYPYDLVHYME